MNTTVKKLGGWLLPLLLAAALLFPMAARAAEYACTVALPVAVRVYPALDGCGFSAAIEAVTEGAPLPEATEITLPEGSGSFAAMTFTAPGDYQYRVRQLQGDAPYMTYDATVYLVTVRVTNAADGGLAAEVWAQREEGGEKSAEILFTNVYNPPTPAPTPAATAQPGGYLPQTGDAAPLALLGAAAVLSALALAALLLLRRRRGKGQ